MRVTNINIYAVAAGQIFEKNHTRVVQCGVLTTWHKADGKLTGSAAAGGVAGVVERRREGVVAPPGERRRDGERRLP